ncbi:glycine zipper domain-containing protein [Rouxiella chamberiensis]|uniref:CsbD family protein n=1 Tax=Rouxiella chamberiensis TaxID=1513468 RepID=A0ABY7HT04_9GAMM|nr:CsbD family protein [Rouxiella chamberiensis]WAT01961.1 CsbD family protein [Rouxiella chamberiensis]
MFNQAQDKVKEVAGTAQEAFGDATNSPEHSAKGAAKKYASQASYAAKDAVATVGDQVKENPYAGVAVAGAVGILIGYLIGRK